MGQTQTSLSSILADVATAVASTQRKLDGLGNELSSDLLLPPLAFVVKQTEVMLEGTLSVRQGDVFSAQARALSFALVNRVQASLRGGSGATLSTRVSVSIQAIEPPHGS